MLIQEQCIILLFFYFLFFKSILFSVCAYHHFDVACSEGLSPAGGDIGQGFE